MERLPHTSIQNYTKALTTNNIAQGYKALMEYLMSLRNHFIKQYSKGLIVGNFYQGYMDMSYFPITPKALKKQQLKIGLVFNHEKVRFEAWLVGQNKRIQQKHWEQLKGQNLSPYKISHNPNESILTNVLVEKPNFNELEELSNEIEKEVLVFIKTISKLLV